MAKKQFTILICSDGFRVRDTSKSIVRGKLIRVQYKVDGKWEAQTLPFEPEPYVPFMKSKYTMFVYTGSRPDTIMVKLAEDQVKPPSMYKSYSKWYDSQPVSIYDDSDTFVMDMVLLNMFLSNSTASGSMATFGAGGGSFGGAGASIIWDQDKNQNQPQDEQVDFQGESASPDSSQAPFVGMQFEEPAPASTPIQFEAPEPTAASTPIQFEAPEPASSPIQFEAPEAAAAQSDASEPNAY